MIFICRGFEQTRPEPGVLGTIPSNLIDIITSYDGLDELINAPSNEMGFFNIRFWNIFCGMYMKFTIPYTNPLWVYHKLVLGKVLLKPLEIKLLKLSCCTWVNQVLLLIYISTIYSTNCQKRNFFLFLQLTLACD